MMLRTYSTVQMRREYSLNPFELPNPPLPLSKEMLIPKTSTENNTYEKLANSNAKAVQGLQPKITVWNTGNEACNADAGAPIRNLFQSLPPLLGTIQEQTGMKPPAWFAQMPNGTESTDRGKGQLSNKSKTVNGHSEY